MEDQAAVLCMGQADATTDRVERTEPVVVDLINLPDLHRWIKSLTAAGSRALCVSTATSRFCLMWRAGFLLLLLSLQSFSDDKPKTLNKPTVLPPTGDWKKFSETKTWAEVVSFLEAKPTPAEIEEKFGKPHIAGKGEDYTTMQYYTLYHRFPDKKTDGLVIVIRNGKISQYGAFEPPKEGNRVRLNPKFAETKTWAAVVAFMETHPTPAQVEEKFGKPHHEMKGADSRTMQYFTSLHRFPDKNTAGLTVAIRNEKVTAYGPMPPYPSRNSKK